MMQARSRAPRHETAAQRETRLKHLRRGGSARAKNLRELAAKAPPEFCDALNFTYQAERADHGKAPEARTLLAQTERMARWLALWDPGTHFFYPTPDAEAVEAWTRVTAPVRMTLNILLAVADLHVRRCLFHARILLAQGVRDLLTIAERAERDAAAAPGEPAAVYFSMLAYHAQRGLFVLQQVQETVPAAWWTRLRRCAWLVCTEPYRWDGAAAPHRVYCDRHRKAVAKLRRPAVRTPRRRTIRPRR